MTCLPWKNGVVSAHSTGVICGRPPRSIAHDLRPECVQPASQEDDYRAYSIKAGKIIYGLGGKVISAGTAPIREMHGDRTRRQMIVVEFPSLEVFERFIDEAENQNIHPLRENSTSDYIWTLYQPWDLKKWVSSAG